MLPPTEFSNIGGMELVAADLLHRLDQKVYAPSLVCLGANNGVIPRIDQSKVSLTVVQKKEALDPSLILHLAAHFIRERCQLVHTFNEGALVYAFPAAKLAGVPALVHAEHGRLPLKERYSLRTVRTLMTRHADHVIAVSEELKALLIEHEHVPKERVSVITNGIDLANFYRCFDRAAFRAECGLTSDEFVIGTVGSLTPQKNHKLLIDAIARVPGVKLFIAGTGPLAQELEDRIAALDLKGRVFCVGQRADVPRFLSCLDLFVLPSLTEGTSLALLEAMASRLPVVATDVGGNHRVVDDRHTGFLVPSNDLNAMVTRLQWCARHREGLHQMGLNGLKRVESAFNFENTLQAYTDIFERVLRLKRGRMRNGRAKVVNP